MHRIKHTEEAKEKMRLAHIGRRVSPATEFKKGSQVWKFRKYTPKGEEHGSWNPNPTYSGIHQWINRMMGKPRKCAECGFTSDNGRQFHWANLSGEYERDISDWKRLCASCHYKMDNISKRSWETRHANTFGG